MIIHSVHHLHLQLLCHHLSIVNNIFEQSFNHGYKSVKKNILQYLSTFFCISLSFWELISLMIESTFFPGFWREFKEHKFNCSAFMCYYIIHQFPPRSQADLRDNKAMDLYTNVRSGTVGTFTAREANEVISFPASVKLDRQHNLFNCITDGQSAQGSVAVAVK